MIDDLNDKILSLTYINAKDSAEMAKWEEIARDTTKSAKERKEAIKNLQKAQDDLVRSVGSTDKSKMNVMLTGLNDKTGLKYSRNDIENFVANTNFNGGKQAEEYKKVYKNYTLLSQSMNNKYDTRSVRERENVLNNYKKQNEYAIKQGHLLEQNDKQRKAMVNTLIEINNGEQQIYQTQQRINKVSRTINKTDQPKTTKVTVKPEVDEKAATGSLAELDQQLTE